MKVGKRVRFRLYMGREVEAVIKAILKETSVRQSSPVFDWNLPATAVLVGVVDMLPPCDAALALGNDWGLIGTSPVCSGSATGEPWEINSCCRDDSFQVAGCDLFLVRSCSQLHPELHLGC